MSKAEEEAEEGGSSGAGAGATAAVRAASDSEYSHSWSTDRILAVLEDPHVYFDGRVFNVPHESDVVENLMWRSLFDCGRNSVSGLARSVLAKSDIHGKNRKALLLALEQAGTPWSSFPRHFRFGTFIKKQEVTRKGVDFKTGEEVDVVRKVPVASSFNMKADDIPEDPSFLETLLMAKVWPLSALHNPEIHSGCWSPPSA